MFVTWKWLVDNFPCYCPCDSFKEHETPTKKQGNLRKKTKKKQDNGNAEARIASLNVWTRIRRWRPTLSGASIGGAYVAFCLGNCSAKSKRKNQESHIKRDDWKLLRSKHGEVKKRKSLKITQSAARS